MILKFNLSHEQLGKLLVFLKSKDNFHGRSVTSDNGDPTYHVHFLKIAAKLIDSDRIGRELHFAVEVRIPSICFGDHHHDVPEHVHMSVLQKLFDTIGVKNE